MLKIEDENFYHLCYNMVEEMNNEFGTVCEFGYVTKEGTVMWRVIDARGEIAFQSLYSDLIIDFLWRTTLTLRRLMKK
jgi:hypothetical protein